MVEGNIGDIGAKDAVRDGLGEVSIQCVLKRTTLCCFLHDRFVRIPAADFAVEIMLTHDMFDLFVDFVLSHIDFPLEHGNKNNKGVTQHIAINAVLIDRI